MAPGADEPELQRDLDAGEDSDAELLRRVAAGDLDAFECLHRRYVGSVYGLALGRLGDRGGAEHATRRTFEEVWRVAAATAPDDGAAARWLFSVAASAIGEQAGESRSDAEDGWLTFRVHAAVAGLPEAERAALELAYWGGRSRGEIADALGLPPATVETRLRSGMARLTIRLEELR